MGKHHAPDPKFAALVKQASTQQDRPVTLETISAPFAGGMYLDPQGRSWRLRANGALDPKRMQLLLHDPAVTVLHQYLWDPIREITAAEREGFWATAEAKMEASAFSRFAGAEYVDGDHRHLLFISESC